MKQRDFNLLTMSVALSLICALGGVAQAAIANIKLGNAAVGQGPGNTDIAISIAYNNVRVGTTDSRTLSLQKGGNGSIQSILFSAASPDFGPLTSFSPLPITVNGNPGQVAQTYTFAPLSTGLQTNTGSLTYTTVTPQPQNRPAVVVNHSHTLNFSGTGVAPSFNSNYGTGGLLDLGISPYGAGNSAALNITNATLSGSLGALNDLTLLSYSITGLNASDFSLSNFVNGTVLHDFANHPLDIAGLFVNLSNTAAPGDHFATLTFHTDQNAALGGNGSDFVFNLHAFVLDPVINPPPTVPEPASLAIWGGLGFAGLCGAWRRKRS